MKKLFDIVCHLQVRWNLLLELFTLHTPDQGVTQVMTTDLTIQYMGGPHSLMSWGNEVQVTR